MQVPEDLAYVGSVAELWGLLADEDRLRVFAAVDLGARSVPDIARHTGMDPRIVVKALQRLEAGGLPPRQASVLRAFLREGRLVSIPTVRSKRLVVLDHIARVFDIGVRYPEREVDALLRAFHDDYAALRRYLVDEGFLARDHAEYWRSGGSVHL